MPAMGETPRSPVIIGPGMLVMPDFERMAKSSAVPRSTGAVVSGHGEDNMKA